MRGHETKIETKEEVIKQRNKKKKKKNGMEVTARVHLLLPAGHSIKGPRPLMDGYLFRVSFLFFRRRRHRRRCCCCCCSPRPSLSFLANSFRSFFWVRACVCVCVCGCNLVIFMLLFRLLLASTGLVPCFTGRYLADKNRSASTTENETKRMGTKKKTLL